MSACKAVASARAVTTYDGFTCKPWLDLILSPSLTTPFLLLPGTLLF